MMRDPQRLQDYLEHILEAIKRIEGYCADIDELGFINSQLIQDMKFSSGGFSPEYGDKLSSVLDITYKKPKKIVLKIDLPKAAPLNSNSRHIP